MRRLLLALAATLALPASAHAEATLSTFTVQPSTTAAGAHPDVVITQEISYSSGSDDVKDAFVRLAPGLGGNPQSAAQCAAEQFRADACPAAAKIGAVQARAFILLVGTDVSGDVYNLRPAGGEPARIGLVLRPPVGDKVFLETPIELKRGADGYGFESMFRDQPRTAGGLDVQIDRVQLTFFGKASRGSFMRNPTACTPATTVGRVSSWDAPATFSERTSAFTPTGCDSLPFTPRVEGSVGAPGLTGKRKRVPLTSVIRLDPEQAALKRTELELPPAVGPSFKALSRACPRAQVETSTCPESSRVGTAIADSPWQAEPVRGPVYLAQRQGLPGLLIVVPPPVGLQLEGEAVQGANGTTNIIDNSPDLPLRSFTIEIFGGNDGLLLSVVDLCAKKTDTRARGVLTAHSGKSVRFTSRFATPGCDPTARAGMRRRGARASLVAAIGAARGGPAITGATVILPKGIRGSRRGLRAKAGGKAVRATVRGRSARLRLPAGGVRSGRISWSRLAVARGLQRNLRRRSTRVAVTVVLRDSRGRTTRRVLKIRPRG